MTRSAPTGILSNSKSPSLLVVADRPGRFSMITSVRSSGARSKCLTKPLTLVKPLLFVIGATLQAAPVVSIVTTVIQILLKPLPSVTLNCTVVSVPSEQSKVILSVLKVSTVILRASNVTLPSHASNDPTLKLDIGILTSLTLPSETSRAP